MRHNRICKIFCAFIVTSAAAALSAIPAAAQTPYDGLWNVTIVTKAGSCEPSTRSTLTVADGKVSAAGAAGKWNGASAGMPCSGRWEASRQ